MTGIFLDQKEVRKKLRDQFSEDRDVLNLFSYTGAFSVIAAQNARSTTSVDLANRSRGLTEEILDSMVLILNPNIFMSWIHLISIIMQHVMVISMKQSLLILLVLPEIRKRHFQCKRL